jgi:citrate synthase
MEAISRIDSSLNRLFFRGLSATSLCAKYDFEAVLFLLINGHLPSANELAEMSEQMIEFRKFYAGKVTSLANLAKSLDQLRSKQDLSHYEILITFVSLAPLIAANGLQSQYSYSIEKPQSSLGHVSNFLWMTKRKLPNNEDVHDFQSSLILHMDDPSNPSLTALIESINDGKTISEALLAAYTTHLGPLHHGAGTEAMKMFFEMKNTADPAKYLRDRLSSGGKIFGLGHRIYTGKDPRAEILEEILIRRTKGTKNEWLLDVIEHVKQDGYSLLKEVKGVEVYPNIDLYNAAVYFSLGYPPEFNTDLFAVARAAGWIAHIIESKHYAH